MELTETKPNIYNFTIKGVDFLFRLWGDDEIWDFNQPAHNASFRFGDRRVDCFISDDVKADKELLKFHIESMAGALIKRYTNR